MIEKFKEIIYLVSKKTGKEELTQTDFKKNLSYDRQWLSPEHVSKFLQICVALRLLEQEGEKYIPTFAFKNIQITLDTKISDDDIDNFKMPTPTRDLFIEIVEFIEQNMGIPRNEIVKNANQIRHRMKYVLPEVAVLMYARTLNLDVSSFFERVKAKIVKSVVR